MKLLLCLLVLGLPCACSTTKPLEKNYYATDFVILEDGTFQIEDEQVSLDNLKQALIARMIDEATHIYIHVHENAPPAVFEELYARLRSRGYSNLSFKVFNTRQ